MNKTIMIVMMLLVTGISNAQSSDSTSWRNVFSDPYLARMIDTALVRNTDIRVANLNVVQAEASLRASRMAFLPSFSLGAEGTVSKSDNSQTDLSYNFPLSVQWEIDLAGRLRGEKRAAESVYWENVELERGVRLQVIAAVASHYYTLVMLDEQLDITRQSIETAKKTVEVMEAMKEVGMQNEAAVSQARTSLFNISASEKTLLQQIYATENALSVLLGERQSEIPRAKSEDTKVNIDHTVSYPLSCLSERPDVKAAEYALTTQMAQVKIARSAFYPSLTISASAGWTNLLGEVVNPGKMLLNAVGSLLQPLFNKGQNQANLSIAKARQEQAMIAFNHSLLVAGTELCDALNACKLSAERSELRRLEVEAARHAYEVSIELMRNSSSTYLEVLTAQTALLQSRLSYTVDWMDYMQGHINLYKSLGGISVSLQP